MASKEVFLIFQNHNFKSVLSLSYDAFRGSMDHNVGINAATNLFGGALDGIFDRVNNSIQQAAQDVKNVGIELEIEAGEEINRAIESLKNAYESELQKTIDKIKPEAKKAFEQIQTMVQKLENHLTDELQNVLGQAQQLANSLPFSKGQPQLTSVRPRNLVIGDVANSSLIILKGNFPLSAKPDFIPTLKFDSIVCYLVDSTTQTLTFQIPHSIFKDAVGNQYSFKTGQLNLFWDDGWVFSHKVSDLYRIGIGALPKIAGQGIVTYKSSNTHPVSQHILNTYKYNGNAFYPEHWHTIEQKIYPAEGWRIDVSKPPSIVPHHRHGDHKQEIVTFSKDLILLKVVLYCRSGSDIGIVDVDIGFDQIRDQTDTNIRTESFEMNWKDSQLLKPQPGETISTVEFVDYKNTKQAYAAPDLNSGVLKIAAESDGIWKVWAEAPKDLTLAHAEYPKKLRDQIEAAKQLGSLKLLHLPM